MKASWGLTKAFGGAGTHLDLNDSQIALGAIRRDQLHPADLPYTEEFERLYAQFLTWAGVSLDRYYVWQALCNARKASKLVRNEG